MSFLCCGAAFSGLGYENAEERLTQRNRLAGQKLVDGEKDLHWERHPGVIKEQRKILAREKKAKIKQFFLKREFT